MDTSILNLLLKVGYGLRLLLDVLPSALCHALILLQVFLPATANDVLRI
jgi:hypothetical protein